MFINEKKNSLKIYVFELKIKVFQLQINVFFFFKLNVTFKNVHVIFSLLLGIVFFK